MIGRIAGQGGLSIGNSTESSYIVATGETISAGDFAYTSGTSAYKSYEAWSDPDWYASPTHESYSSSNGNGWSYTQPAQVRMLDDERTCVYLAVRNSSPYTVSFGCVDVVSNTGSGNYVTVSPASGGTYSGTKDGTAFVEIYNSGTEYRFLTIVRQLASPYSWVWNIVKVDTATEVVTKLTSDSVLSNISSGGLMRNGMIEIDRQNGKVLVVGNIGNIKAIVLTVDPINLTVSEGTVADSGVVSYRGNLSYSDTNHILAIGNNNAGFDALGVIVTGDTVTFTSTANFTTTYTTGYDINNFTLSNAPKSDNGFCLGYTEGGYQRFKAVKHNGNGSAPSWGSQYNWSANSYQCGSYGIPDSYSIAFTYINGGSVYMKTINMASTGTSFTSYGTDTLKDSNGTNYCPRVHVISNQYGVSCRSCSASSEEIKFSRIEGTPPQSQGIQMNGVAKETKTAGQSIIILKPSV